MKKIVVIDDQSTTRLILAQLIEQLEFDEEIKPKLFSSAHEAIKWIQLNSADLIVVDQMMPEMSGHEFLVTIKNDFNCRNIPVVIISADNDKELKYQVLEDGAVDFLPKPLDYRECSIKFKNILKQQKQDILLPLKDVLKAA